MMPLEIGSQKVWRLVLSNNLSYTAHVTYSPSIHRHSSKEKTSQDHAISASETIDNYDATRHDDRPIYKKR